MAKKITQKQRYEALIELVEVNGISVTNGEVGEDEITEGADEMVAFLRSRIDSLEKKVSKADEKADKTKAEVDDNVLSVMTADKVKVSEVVKMLRENKGIEYNSSKVTASLRRLMTAGLVGNVVEKKNSYYFLVG